MARLKDGNEDPRAIGDIVADMNRFKAELASVQDVLANARLARRSIRDDIAADCIRRDTANQIILSWRPMTAEELDRLDAIHARTAPTLKEYMPREASLKEAVRLTEIELQTALKDRGSNRGKTGGKTGEALTPGCHGDPIVTGDRGPAPRLPPATGGATGVPQFTDGSPMARQGDLF